MKHTLMYLKVIVVVLLCLIVLAGFVLGGLSAIVGLICALVDNSARPLLLVIVGLFCGFMGFVALDALNYIDNKWSWKV
jgi:hypothetical protein